MIELSGEVRKAAIRFRREVERRVDALAVRIAAGEDYRMIQGFREIPEHGELVNPHGIRHITAPDGEDLTIRVSYWEERWYTVITRQGTHPIEEVGTIRGVYYQMYNKAGRDARDAEARVRGRRDQWGNHTNDAGVAEMAETAKKYRAEEARLLALASELEKVKWAAERAGMHRATPDEAREWLKSHQISPETSDVLRRMMDPVMVDSSGEGE